MLIFETYRKIYPAKTQCSYILAIIAKMGLGEAPLGWWRTKDGIEGGSEGGRGGGGWRTADSRSQVYMCSAVNVAFSV